ncbi:MAG: hypothetical protein QOK31_212 [Solirubrobacteraceae bacterium]|nr:hypothetical protein [Solirubrobacteraceae bacterium]
MALGLAYLFGAGATLVILTLLLPHGSRTDDLAVLSAPLAAYVVVGVLLRYGRGLPLGAYHAILGWGSVLITVCVFFGGDDSAAYTLLYVWVALYAFYFFSVGAAVAHVVFASAVYASVLIARDLSNVPEVQWLMTAGTISVAGTLIGRLIGQVRAQAADLAAVAQIANGISSDADLAGAREAICGAVADSCRADAVALLEARHGTLSSAASAGTSELAGRLLEAPEALAAYTEGRRTIMHAGRRVIGIAEPILLDGRSAGVLAVGWNRPRRRVADAPTAAVTLFAAEASVALERARRLTRELERRALEINDNVVQGLVLAKYALASGRAEEGARAVDDTLARARELMSEQLPEVEPGDLRRAQPSSVAPTTVE